MMVLRGRKQKCSFLNCFGCHYGQFLNSGVLFGRCMPNALRFYADFHERIPIKTHWKKSLLYFFVIFSTRSYIMIILRFVTNEIIFSFFFSYILRILFRIVFQIKNNNLCNPVAPCGGLNFKTRNHIVLHSSNYVKVSFLLFVFRNI